MYIYEFVKVDLKSGFMKSSPKEDYHVVIDSYAADGWRFNQIFAPAISGYGAAPYFELIFEKEVDTA
jgi:hypothetical protein